MARKFKCKYCQEFKEESIRLPVGRFCCYEHATKWATEKREREFMRKLNKETKEKEKADRAKHKAKKESLKSLNDYASEAQAAVNSYIRVRDHNKPCISCGCNSVSVFGGYRGAGGWDAGHYRSRGAANHLRFNLLNIHKQCVKCNRDRSGNVVDYRIRLIKRIGLENVEAIESNNKPRKFTKQHLQRIKKIFNRRARWYRKRRNID